MNQHLFLILASSGMLQAASGDTNWIANNRNLNIDLPTNTTNEESHVPTGDVLAIRESDSKQSNLPALWNPENAVQSSPHADYLQAGEPQDIKCYRGDYPQPLDHLYKYIHDSSETVGFITYSIDNWINMTSRAEMRAAAQKAFGRWAKESNIVFREEAPNAGLISIRIGNMWRYKQKDGELIAGTFSLENNFFIVFNQSLVFTSDDRRFKVEELGAERSWDWTLTHEIGHLMGFRVHSCQSISIMHNVLNYQYGPDSLYNEPMLSNPDALLVRKHYKVSEADRGKGEAIAKDSFEAATEFPRYTCPSYVSAIIEFPNYIVLIFDNIGFVHVTDKSLRRFVNKLPVDRLFKGIGRVQGAVYERHRVLVFSNDECYAYSVRSELNLKFVLEVGYPKRIRDGEKTIAHVAAAYSETNGQLWIRTEETQTRPHSPPVIKSTHYKFYSGTNSVFNVGNLAQFAHATGVLLLDKGDPQQEEEPDQVLVCFGSTCQKREVIGVRSMQTAEEPISKFFECYDKSTEAEKYYSKFEKKEKEEATVSRMRISAQTDDHQHCTARSSFFSPDPCSRHFYACITGSSYRFTCPSPSVFDRRKKRCTDRVDIEECNDLDKAHHGECTEKKAFHSHHPCSNHFFSCIAGSSYRFSCPSPSVFDRRKKRCADRVDIEECNDLEYG